MQAEEQHEEATAGGDPQRHLGDVPGDHVVRPHALCLVAGERAVDNVEWQEVEAEVGPADVGVEEEDDLCEEEAVAVEEGVC